MQYHVIRNSETQQDFLYLTDKVRSWYDSLKPNLSKDKVQNVSNFWSKKKLPLHRLKSHQSYRYRLAVFPGW